MITAQKVLELDIVACWADSMITAMLTVKLAVFGLGHGLLRSRSPKAKGTVTEVYYYVVNL